MRNRFGPAVVAVVVVGAIALAPPGGSGQVRITAAVEPTTRHYYVQAEQVVWDFAPSDSDLMVGEGEPLPAPWTKHHAYAMYRYVEYTDASFTVPKPQPPWLGVLGPVIRAVTGDTLAVHFRNATDRPLTMHPHGVRYAKASEGAFYQPPVGPGAAVAPGAAFDYTWVADERSGPGPADPSSVVWWYHSHVDEPAEVNLGLVGAIIVTDRERARADATPLDVDREYVTSWQVFDLDAGKERGMMHSINGYVFANLPGLTARVGERVRWHSIGMGNEIDLHTPHWHANTLDARGHTTDVVELLPGSMATADMPVVSEPGTWLLHCHVSDHIHAGMVATYTVTP